MPPKKKKVLVKREGFISPDYVHPIDQRIGPCLDVSDYILPRTVIQRLAKGVLPPDTQIDRLALVAILKATTVFINYLANSADDRAELAGKKTIRPEDVLGALEDTEFGDFAARVEMELNKYQDIQNDKRNGYRRRVKGDQEASTDPPAGPADDQSRDTESLSAHSQREKSTTPRIVTLGNGSREEDTDADADAEVDVDGDSGPPAKKAKTSFPLPRGPSWRSGTDVNGDDDGGDDVLDSDTELDVDDNDDEVDDDQELEYQSAEDEAADDEPNDDDEGRPRNWLGELQDESELGDSDSGGLNPDPDDGDPSGSDEDD